MREQVAGHLFCTVVEDDDPVEDLEDAACVCLIHEAESRRCLFHNQNCQKFPCDHFKEDLDGSEEDCDMEDDEDDGELTQKETLTNTIECCFDLLPIMGDGSSSQPKFANSYPSDLDNDPDEESFHPCDREDDGASVGLVQKMPRNQRW